MAAETITDPPSAESATATEKKTTTRKRKTTTASGASKATAGKKGGTGSARTSTRSRAKAAAPAMDLDLSAHAAALPREVAGLLFVVLGLGVLLALVSFDPADLAHIKPANLSNLIGPVGARVGDALLTLFGLGAFCFDALLWYVGLMLLLGKRFEWKPSEVTGLMLFVGAGTILSHLAFTGEEFFGRLPGGVTGELCAELLRGLFGTVGASMIGGSALLLSLMLATSLSLSVAVRAIMAGGHRFMAYLRHRWRVHLEFRARLAEERARLLADRDGATIDPVQREAELAITPVVQGDYGYEERLEEDVERKLTARLSKLFRRMNQPPAQIDHEDDAEPSDDPPSRDADASVAATEDAEAEPSKGKSKRKPRIVKNDAPAALLDDTADASEGAEDRADVDDAEALTAIATTRAEVAAQADSDASDDGDGPRIVARQPDEDSEELREMLRAEASKGILFNPQKRGDFELPAISYLNYEDNPEHGVDEATLREMAAQIERTLSDFKVEGQIRDICPGPVITVFEFSPAPGVKISKISGLADDLAMALSALSVRIVAPIPGKGVVGIEVPNPSREMVFMKEIIAHKAFMANTKMALPLGLGKDTAGNPVVTDLARMPHLLVAGATGSGKSVAVNTMITSLLYTHSPDDVRLIMVDPKMLEFSIYADIPHLLLPVVTDPREATAALNWAVQEMERRYQRLADLNVRNIKGYNEKIEALTARAQEDMAAGLEDTPAIRALGIDAEGNPEHKRIPYIVVIIDEFADLMMTASKDVETAVARLAQKARAAGLHLILATQRPSTDVITGLIKANFPTRVALRVTSKTDSRVILDSNGAEGLLGNGDMLFVPPGTSFVQRVHGAYVSEKEIEQIVEFLKSQRPASYDETIVLTEPEEGDAPEGFGEEDKDEHYHDAVRIVVESRQASISMIQRKLRVGYNRAARMVEFMEYEGIVAPADGCKPREVLLDVSPY